MSIHYFLTRAEVEGVTVTLSTDQNGDPKISVTGNPADLENLTPAIRERKAEVIRYLVSGGRCAACAKSICWNGETRCIGRTDLPPVYGVNHPHRYPPADGGIDCEAYQPRPETLAARNAEEARVLDWLARTGEDDPAAIEQVLGSVRRSQEGREYFLMRADEIKDERMAQHDH